MISGPNSCYPIAMLSKGQTCVSHSTPEAELVAMDTTLRVIAMPPQIMCTALVPHMKATVFRGDNEAMLHVIKTRRSPSMRYIARTHRVSVAWLHEVYVSGVCGSATKRLHVRRLIYLLRHSIPPPRCGYKLLHYFRPPAPRDTNKHIHHHLAGQAFYRVRRYS